jgi:signal transduction histidine kinase
VQELLFNIVKHSGVKKAAVGVEMTDHLALVTVCDRGRGFNPEILDSVSEGHGLGLLSLRERISYIGGNLSIDSAKGQESRFTLTFPVRMEKKNNY